MYVLMCIIILRQFHRRRVKRGLDRTSLLTLAFTVAMIAVTTGWYLTSALYNSLLLAGGVLTLPPSEQLDALTMCNPEAIARDVFKGLQMVLADALLVCPRYRNAETPADAPRHSSGARGSCGTRTTTSPSSPRSSGSASRARR
jgi:hypothetical protein